MEMGQDDQQLKKSLSAEEKLCLEELTKIAFILKDECCLDQISFSCTSNGLDYSEKASYKHVQELELFLTGISVIPPLRQFSGVTRLLLIGHQISKIQHFEPLMNLEELWLCECGIKVIENLEANKQLKKLYLYGNEISKIEHISHLNSLEVLWLNGNRITKIEGINTLEVLIDLNLSENLIYEIGKSLESNKMLETLSLSGNQISSIKDTTNLSALPKLRSLSMKDPLYSPCPVALLCNYAVHMLYHLPALTTLDSQDVSMKSMKEIAETTVTKKIMYYKMRLKTLERGFNETVKKLRETKERLQTVPSGMQQKLWFAVKEIERELEELNVPSKAMSFAVCETKENRSDCTEADKICIPEVETRSNESEADGLESDDSSNEDELEELLERVNLRKDKLKTKLKTLNDRIAFWQKRFYCIELSYKETSLQARHLVDHQIDQLMLELETVGNVRFEHGTEADSWYSAVYDLFMSRFTELDYRDIPVVSVKIHRIMRIYNKSLHMRFDNKMENTSHKDESFDINRDENRVLDYLFNIWDHSQLDNKRDLFHKIENGFECNRNSAVHLTNSLGVSDKSRVKYILKRNSDKDATEKHDFRYGRLLVCKTFLGRSCKVAKGEKKVNKQQYQSYDSAFQTRRHAICPTKAKTKSTIGITELCDCTLRRCTWHVFDAELILPEYLVEFEYITKNTEPLAATLCGIVLDDRKNSIDAQIIDSSIAADEKLTHTDQNIINMEPAVKTRPRLTVLTEDLLLKHTGASYVNRITILNLNGSGLGKLKLLSTLSNLKKLIVSFNDLTSLQDLSGMSNLEYLDASFNKITSIDGFKGCIHLSYLDMSWNRLHYTREEVGLIRKYLPAIKFLNVKYNPFLKPETLRMRCIGRLRNLTTMDNEVVTEDEAALAIRMAACSRIAYVTVLAHSRTDTDKPRTLSLESACSVIMMQSRNKPVKLYEDDKKWFYKVTCLQLDNQHLSKISNLEHLENLKFVSFSYNDITKIEGLENCPRIEELSLVGNCITKLEGIDHLLHLRSLSLDNNNLMTIDGTNFEKLIELRHLSLENNFITRLKSLQRATSLYDLFLGNNRILNLREIFHLKNIQSLAILDLIGNPMIHESSDYRLFTIYHIQSLRALDGTPVDQIEEAMARDAYGGRLTQDFVAERLGHSNFVEVCELDLPNQGVRSIDLGNGDSFGYLTSVNLEHNNLTNFGGLIQLINLKVLCLNFNQIESIVARPKALQAASSPSHNKATSDLLNLELSTPVLQRLEVLHLGFNGISNLPAIQLGRLRNLKTLFLQGNEIAKVEGLEGLTELRELVLDKNKIKSFAEYSFASQWKLHELHCEENRLRELANLEHLANLQRLFIGLNRIQESAEIERLERLPNLIELSVIGNPVSRRLMHRPMLVFRQPNLISIDGIAVTNEERAKAELYFLEQQGGVQLLQTLAGAANVSLPGINAAATKATGQVPLKVTQVQLSGSNHEFAYQLGQRIYSLDRLQNLTPPPFSGSDYHDYNKHVVILIDHREALNRGSDYYIAPIFRPMASSTKTAIPLVKECKPFLNEEEGQKSSQKGQSNSNRKSGGYQDNSDNGRSKR